MESTPENAEKKKEKKEEEARCRGEREID
jgi:hypothetical protein